MSTDSFGLALKNKLLDINSDLEVKRAEVRRILEDIQGFEEQAEHIIRLLEAEGVSIDEIGLEARISMSVSDMAYEALASQVDKRPLHYRRIANIVTSNGRLIPGKDPAANLVTQLSRDSRFIRTARGTYGLAEWGLTPQKRTRRKKKRK
jgi:hypothetical protein